MSSLTRLIPGLLLVGTLSLGALWLARFTLPLGIAPVALGVLAGLLVGNTVRLGPEWSPGVSFAGRRLLTAAVVLLGLRMSFHELSGFGIPLAVAVAVVLGVVLLALVVGRWWGVSSPMAAMIGAGTAVCGVAAVAAVRPVVSGREEETAYAVGAVALLGSLGLIVFPVVQLVWHPLDPGGFGVFSGAVLHSVPQAVGAGFAGGGETGGFFATMVKLTRVALLGPLVLLLIAGVRFLGARAEGSSLPSVPVEVWGFLLAAAVANLVPLPRVLVEGARVASGLLLVVALTALGVSTRFRDLKATGFRPLILAVLLWAVAVAGVLFALRIVGPLEM